MLAVIAFLLKSRLCAKQTRRESVSLKLYPVTVREFPNFRLRNKNFMIILSGEIAFAIGHIFYFVALILTAPFTYWSVIVGAVLAAGIFAVG